MTENWISVRGRRRSSADGIGGVAAPALRQVQAALQPLLAVEAVFGLYMEDLRLPLTDIQFSPPPSRPSCSHPACISAARTASSRSSVSSKKMPPALSFSWLPKVGTAEKLHYPVNDIRGITDVNRVAGNLEAAFSLKGGVYNLAPQPPSPGGGP